MGMSVVVLFFKKYVGLCRIRDWGASLWRLRRRARTEPPGGTSGRAGTWRTSQVSVLAARRPPSVAHGRGPARTSTSTWTDAGSRSVMPHSCRAAGPSSNARSCTRLCRKGASSWSPSRRNPKGATDLACHGLHPGLPPLAPSSNLMVWNAPNATQGRGRAQPDGDAAAQPGGGARGAGAPWPARRAGTARP